MSEHDQQAILVKWARQNAHRYPCLKHLHANTNGTHRGRGAKAGIHTNRLKAEGMLNGVPDLFLPVARLCGNEAYHGLYIEMKDGRGKTTPAQDAFMEGVRAEGYKAVVCNSGLSAIEVLKQYLDGIRWTA